MLSAPICMEPSQPSRSVSLSNTESGNPIHNGGYYNYQGLRRLNLYGIDGCKGGWVVGSKSEEANIPSFSVVSDLTSLFATAERGGVVAIDIPIGLSDSSPRQCDVEARR